MRGKIVWLSPMTLDEAKEITSGGREVVIQMTDGRSQWSVRCWEGWSSITRGRVRIPLKGDG